MIAYLNTGAINNYTPSDILRWMNNVGDPITNTFAATEEGAKALNVIYGENDRDTQYRVARIELTRVEANDHGAR